MSGFTSLARVCAGIVEPLPFQAHFHHEALEVAGTHRHRDTRNECFQDDEAFRVRQRAHLTHGGGLTALFALRACAGDVNIKEWERVLSPDGWVDAVVLSSGGGGALGSDVFWVTLVPAGTRVAGKENDVFGELRALAVAGGMRTRREDGLRLVLAGRITPEEVLRVTRA